MIVAPTSVAPGPASGLIVSSSVKRLLLAVIVGWFIYLLFGSTNGFGWIDSWHNEQRALQLVLLAATAATLVPVYFGPLVGRIPTLPWPFWLLVLSGLASAPVAAFPFDTLGEVALFTALAGMVFASTIVFRTWFGASLWFQRAALLLGAAHCVGILVRYVTALALQDDLATDILLLGYANPRFASAFYILLMPFLAGQTLSRHERPVLRYAAFATLVLLWTFNLALGTRAVPFSVALGSIAFAVLAWKRRPLSIIWMMLVSLIFGAVLYAVLFHLLPGWLGTSAGLHVNVERILNSSGRDKLVELSLVAVRSAPLLGIGPMQFAAIPQVPNAHPHNWLLQLIAEYGVPSGLIVVVALAVWFWRLRERLAPATLGLGGDLLEPALLMTLVALSCGLVDGNLVMPISQSAAAIGLGALLASLPEPTPKASSAPVRATGLAVIAAAILVAAYGYVSFSEQEDSSKRYHELYERNRDFSPRFWEQGLLIAPK